MTAWETGATVAGALFGLGVVVLLGWAFAQGLGVLGGLVLAGVFVAALSALAAQRGALARSR